MYVFCYLVLFAALYALASLDFLLAAVFLCKIFFAADLSIASNAVLRTVAAEASLLAIACLHFLIVVFNTDFLILFLRVLVLDTFTLFIADFIFGNPFTSCELINKKYFNTKENKKQGI